MPPGALALTASAEGYAATQATLSAPVDGVVLRLIPGGSLRGVVVSAADGEPVADVEVRAQLLQRNALAAPSAWSDEFGEFVIQGLEPGVYKLLAISADARGELPRPLELALGTTIDGLRVAVGPATEVSGHVRLAGDKQRCRQGFVQLGAPDPTMPMSPSAQLATSSETTATSVPLHFTSQIDVEGRVRFKGVPPGRYFVTVRCEGHLLQSGPDVIEVSTTPYTDLLWEVEPGAGLTVKVVDSRGRPVSGAGFLVQWPAWHAGGRAFVVPGTTGEDGTFVYPNILHEGVYEVSPAPPFDAPKLTVELKSGEGRREVTLRLSGDAWIVVDAQTPTRAGVDSLHVVATALSEAGQAAERAFPATRLGEGRYRIGPLSAGIYLVEAHDGINAAFRPPEGEGRVLVAAGAERTIRIELDRGAELRGRVADEAGQPLADVWVSVSQSVDSGAVALRPLSRMMSGASRVLTDSEGFFVIEGLTGGGTFDLRAEQSSGSTVVKRGVRPGSEVSIAFPATGSIAGSVLDLKGSGAVGAIVTATHLDTGQQQSLQLGQPDGAFSFENVAPGKVEIVAQGEGATQARISAELQPKQQLTGIALTLEPLAVVQRVIEVEPRAGQR